MVYLDDVLIYIKNDPEKHQQLVSEVLRRFEEAELYVNLDKTQFHTQKVKFLEHIVGVNGIRMNSEKISAVQDWSISKNVKNVQSFTGFCNYYRRFIKDYSKIATPLYRFTKKEQPFTWDTPAEKAFQKLKNLILQDSILKTFDSEREAIVEIDASDFAIGARLYQIHNEKKHLIAFISKKLQDVKTRWLIHDKELYVIIFTCSQ